MKKLHKVLIIDDHPVLCERYDELCDEVMKRNPQIRIKTELAGNCDTAKEKINNTWNHLTFNFNHRCISVIK